MNEFLTNTEINQFKKDGAIFVKGKFGLDWIEKLKKGIEKDIKNPSPRFKSHTIKNGIPAYRHTVLSLPENEMLHHQLEDLVDIAIYECEKYYPAFQLVLFEDTSPIKALSVSTFDIIGRA